ncbi:MAG: Uncharacterized protein FD152_817 [Xanthobacteraceae bacterium]|nr:MAG: Uncharacterized protein FD152_817 [Xanthobacteraceae bacterium]
MSDDNDQNPRKRKVPLYSVGKGKPPMDTRFKKGVSGNPSGKRKRPKDPWEAMADLLANRTCSVMIENERQQVPIGEAFIMRLGNDAMQGKPAQTKMFFDLWIETASRSAKERIDDLSPADEEVLATLGGILRTDGNPTSALAGEIRFTIEPDELVSIEAEQIDRNVLDQMEREIAEGIASGGDPLEVIDAVLASMRPRQPSSRRGMARSRSAQAKCST